MILPDREGLIILETFIESKSAKKPGREVFNEMIEKIYASKELVGILAWHPDRLARNSVDGGQIIYLIDITKIGALRFPTFWFEPTPQGLFMLQVAFGQSKYYSDNLSENVKRGIRQKIRRGEYPSLAQVGYINNPKTRNVEINEEKAKIIRQVFKEFSEGGYSLNTMSQRMNLLGFVGKMGKPLSKSSVIKILTNQTYIGLIKHKGEMHEGKFEPIVDKETFDAVQEEIKNKAKPRIQKHGKDFAFTGLIKCGECGGMITAQYAKKGKYIYYRCSKRMGTNCSQPYVQDVVLLGQLQAKLSKIALPKSWSEIALSHLEQRQREEVREQQSFCQNIEKQITETEGKIDRLVNNFLDEMIEQDLYLKKKEELLKTKVELQEKLKNFGKKGVVWFELSKNCVKAAHQAETLASTTDLLEIKSFIKKFGSNRHLIQKKVFIDFEKPFDLVSKYRTLGRLGLKNKKRDEEQKMLVVSLSRGEKTRTSDPYVPNVVR